MSTKLEDLLLAGLKKEFPHASIGIKREIRIIYNGYILCCVFNEGICEEVIANNPADTGIVEMVVEEVKNAREVMNERIKKEKNRKLGG